MGSEGPSAVTIHVTGFKKFHGVTENPTETIVSNLKEFLQKKGLPKGVVLGSCNILETAGHGALVPLYKILENSVAGLDSDLSNSNRVIWLHFGVNSGASRFAIEQQAVNEATFRCPDELGWKPQKLPIIPSDGGISRAREASGAGRHSQGTVALPPPKQPSHALDFLLKFPITTENAYSLSVQVCQNLASMGSHCGFC